MSERTTLTLDDDIVSLLNREQKKTRRPLKQLVNEALRRGLLQLQQPKASKKEYKLNAASLGRCYLSNLDDISNALAVAEGENFR